jgi:multiple sugar transport system substrate-binding protein
MRKALVAALLLLAMSSSSCAFGEKPVELVLGAFTSGDWGVPNPDSLVLFDKAIAGFESKNPGIRVSYRSGMLREDYSEWCAQQALKDTLPDVFMVLPEDFISFASLGMLKDLDKLIEGDRAFDASSFYSSALEAGQVNNSQSALPYEIAPTMMFVNKSLLLAEGIELPTTDWTWEEFYRICEMVAQDKNQDGILDQFGCLGFSWEESAFTNGAELFSENGASARFNTSRFASAVSFAKRINSLNKGVDLESVDFDKGRVAFCPLSFSHYRAYKPYPYRIKKYSSFEWDCLPMPISEEGGYTSELQTLLMGMSARGKHQDEAWQLLKYMTSDEGMQLLLLEHSNGFSAIRSILESEQTSLILRKDMPSNENFVDLKLLGQVIEEACTMPNIKHYNAAKALADGLLYPAIHGNASVDSAIKTLQREATNLLEN